MQTAALRGRQADNQHATHLLFAGARFPRRSCGPDVCTRGTHRRRARRANHGADRVEQQGRLGRSDHAD